MEKVLRCDCGFEVRADTEDKLVEGIRDHALEAHGMSFTAEDALLVALRQELDSVSTPGASRSNEREEPA